MLAEERFQMILSLVKERKTVTVQELTKRLAASESTIRRDLTVLHEKGLLIKVFGGAASVDVSYATRDDTVEQRQDLNREDKLAVARFAAHLIEKDDFVFLDAGTSTGLMIDFIAQSGVVFVTDCITHARRLAEKGFSAYMLGGELKAATDAVVGGNTLKDLERYNFTKGFFGTNGIHLQNGFSTPDMNEALVKEKAMKRCKQCFILADASKFNKISPVTFGSFSSATVITTKLKDAGFQKYSNVWEAEKDDIHHNL